MGLPGERGGAPANDRGARLDVGDRPDALARLPDLEVGVGVVGDRAPQEEEARKLRYSPDCLGS